MRINASCMIEIGIFNTHVSTLIQTAYMPCLVVNGLCLGSYGYL